MTALSLKRLLAAALFPVNCPLCRGRTDRCGYPCASCTDRFRQECGEVCPDCGKGPSFCRCGSDFPGSGKTELAGSTFTALAFYHSSRHTGSLSADGRLTERMLYRFKQSGEFADFLADELSTVLWRRFTEAGEDPSGWRIVYPPRSRRKAERLGFDQSAEAASRIGQNLGIPAENVFTRTAEAGEQKLLNAEQRREQAESSLLPIREKIVPGGKYILLDDIVTSGATVLAAEKLLFFCGAAAVYPAAVARTLSNLSGAEKTPVPQNQI